MRLTLIALIELTVLTGALPARAADANSSSNPAAPKALDPEALDQAFATLRSFDVKPEADAPPAKEADGEKKSPYAIYRLELEQQLSDWQGVIEMAVAQAQQDAALRRDIEQRFLAALQAGVSKAAQKYICRQLGMIATDRAVPAMAPLLDDAELSHMARFVLEQIPGPAPEQLLLEKLGTARSTEKIGIITSLGKRRVIQATETLTSLLEGPDPQIAAAAAAALGNIGDANAARVLMKVQAANSAALTLPLEDCAAAGGRQAGHNTRQITGKPDLSIAEPIEAAADAVGRSAGPVDPGARPGTRSSAGGPAIFTWRRTAPDRPDGCRLAPATGLRGACQAPARVAGGNADRPAGGLHRAEGVGGQARDYPYRAVGSRPGGAAGRLGRFGRTVQLCGCSFSGRSGCRWG